MHNINVFLKTFTVALRGCSGLQMLLDIMEQLAYPIVTWFVFQAI